MTLLVLLLLLVLALSVLLVVPKRIDREARREPHPNVDPEELRQAEDELEQLSHDVTPDEADDHLPDWGPGVPKYNRDSPG